MKRPVLKLCRCAAAVLFAALLAALFAGCIRIGDTDSDKQSPAGKTDRYVWQNSHGDKLSAAPGYAHISVTKSLDAAGRNVAVRIPTIFAYTDAAFSMGAESTENGFCELVFSYGGYTDTAFVKTYAEALDGCGFSLEKTWVLDDKQTIYYLKDRNGGITRGADDFLGTKYDLSITVFHSVSTTSLIFAYPPEVGFDTDAADAVYTTLELAVDYAAENGKDIFRIGGWGDSAKDQIVLSIDGGRYQTGDVLQKADFAAQANAGANALCSIAIWGSTISRDSAGWPVYIESLDDVTVTVLARSGGVLAIAYAIDAPSGSAHYKLEGVCAAATDDGQFDAAAESDETSGLFKPNKNCIHCHGSGKVKCTLCNGATFSTCHTCGGDGLEQCTLCHGAGQYYANGGMNTCSGCFGRGTTKCTSCIGGRVTCTNCHGRGTVTCRYCLGLGK